MKSYYETKPFRSQPTTYDEEAPLRWEIQWSTLIPVSVASVLSTVTLVMVAILVSRSPGTSDTCDIYYDTENSITRLELHELSMFSTGLFGTPKGADCDCPSSNSQPVYIAPIDLCNPSNFPPISSTTPPLCLEDPGGSKFRDHVLVCVDSAAIDRLWSDGFCKAAVGPRLDNGRLVCKQDTPNPALKQQLPFTTFLGYYQDVMERVFQHRAVLNLYARKLDIQTLSMEVSFPHIPTSLSSYYPPMNTVQHWFLPSRSRLITTADRVQDVVDLKPGVATMVAATSANSSAIAAVISALKQYQASYISTLNVSYSLKDGLDDNLNYLIGNNSKLATTLINKIGKAQLKALEQKRDKNTFTPDSVQHYINGWLISNQVWLAINNQSPLESSNRPPISTRKSSRTYSPLYDNRASNFRR